MNPPFMQGKYRKQFEAYVAQAVVQKQHNAPLVKLDITQLYESCISGSNPERRANLPS